MPVKITVKMNFSAAGAAAKIRNSVAKAMPDLTEEIQVDCNAYAPERGRVLVDNANIDRYTNGLSAEIRWGVPYAKYMYGGKRKDGSHFHYTKKIPAEKQYKWCKAAKKDHSDEWRLKLKKTAKENYKK